MDISFRRSIVHYRSSCRPSPLCVDDAEMMMMTMMTIFLSCLRVHLGFAFCLSFHLEPFLSLPRGGQRLAQTLDEMALLATTMMAHHARSMTLRYVWAASTFFFNVRSSSGLQHSTALSTTNQYTWLQILREISFSLRSNHHSLSREDLRPRRLAPLSIPPFEHTLAAARSLARTLSLLHAAQRYNFLQLDILPGGIGRRWWW